MQWGSDGKQKFRQKELWRFFLTNELLYNMVIYYNYSIPRVYHIIVSNRYYSKVRTQTQGKCLQSRIPVGTRTVPLRREGKFNMAAHALPPPRSWRLVCSVCTVL